MIRNSFSNQDQKLFVKMLKMTLYIIKLIFKSDKMLSIIESKRSKMKLKCLKGKKGKVTIIFLYYAVCLIPN